MSLGSIVRGAIALTIIAAGLGAAKIVSAAPALDIYGRLPGIEMAAMSPSGNRVALIGRVQDQRRLLVIEEGKTILVSDVGSHKLRGVSWSDENRVLVRVSYTVALGIGFTADKTELSSVLVVPLDGKPVWSIFQGKSRITGGVQGRYGIVTKDGRSFGYFGGITLDRNYGSDPLLTTTNPDLYEVNLHSGDIRLVSRRIEDRLGDREWLVDAEGKVVANLDFFPNHGNWTLRNADRGTLVSGQAPLGGIDLEALSPEGNGAVYYLHDPDTGTGRYLDQPFNGGPPKELMADETVISLITNARTNRLMGFLRGGDRPEAHFFDARREKVMTATRKAFPGVSVRLVDSNDAFDKLLVETSGTGDPETLWTVDIKTGKADILGISYPMPAEDVGPVSMFNYAARDGLSMSGVLTLPPGREARNLPLVMLPHGGPAARDYPVFDWWAQAFASRGYAVFQPNFRGSTGLGASFRLAGRNEWGRKMQTDVSDGLEALARRGMIDPKRACIVGASYGGYAALAGVTLQQGLYRCAVSVAGVADVSKLAATERRESGGNPTIARWLKVEIGVGRDLRQISPAAFADRADAPILMIHGADDIVVPFDQSSDMAAALKRAGKPHELIKLAGEDHWLSRSETRLTMLKAAVGFVEKHNPPDPAPAAPK